MTRSYTFTQDYNDYLVYEWTARDKVPVEDIAGVSWNEENGVYSFRMELPKILDEVTEDNRNDVVMEITLTMPKTIDLANSTYVDGSSVRWVITKDQLSRGVTLKAFTE